MRARRTHVSNTVFALPGGTEDNDLWLYRELGGGPNGSTLLRSCWVPTDVERKAIAEGANIELIIWGDGHPPVSVQTCDYPLGAPPRGPGESS